MPDSPYSPRPPRLRRLFASSTMDSAVGSAGIAMHVLVVLALQLTPGVTWQGRHTVQVVAEIVSFGLLSFVAWRAATDARVDAGGRLAWRSLAIAVSAQWAAYAAYGVAEVRGDAPLMRAVSDAVYLLSYPFLLVGLLRFPRPVPERPRRAIHSLDAAIVVVAGGVVLLHLALLPGAVESAATSREVLAYAAVYPLGDAIMLVGATVLWLREPSDARRGVVTLLGISLLVLLVADGVYAYRIGYRTYQTGSFLDVLWATSALLMAVAAHWQRVSARSPAGHEVAAPPGLHQPALPYLASAIVFALLLMVATRDSGTATRVLAGGATLVTALVLARQWVAVRENVRLAGDALAREGEARFRALVQHASDMLLIIDGDFAVRYASPAALDALGTPAGALVGSRLLELVHPTDVGDALRLLGRAVASGRESVRGEWRFRATNGRTIHAEHVATSLLDEPTVRGIVLNSRDVSERAELERQLTHQAFHDPLTRLANRTLFLDRLEHAFRRGARAPGTVSLLFLDLDDFKRVNDSLGHAAGDVLLVETSARIAAELREGDTLARLGGDEFAILLENVDDAGMSEAVAARVLEALRAPVTVEGKAIHVGVSIGIANSRDAANPSELMRNADLAMYIAKTRGKGACAVFEPHMHSDVATRLDIEADLRKAIEADELRLVFQPVVGLHHRQLLGVEALVRWTHPTRGEIPPATFIPIAEEAGLVVALGRWVLCEACRQARRWRDETGEQLHVGVNISARQIHDASLIADVRMALEESDIPPEQLLLEITESVLMRDSDDAAGVLQALKTLGVSLALDDFGTGYSSLSYLQRFPIDLLKIDRSFVAPMAARSFDPRLVRAILALGESLGMRIVAEGIETEGQLQALRELGCEMGQGYLFARPLTSDQLLARIREELAMRPTASGGGRLVPAFAAAR
ncbi:MAG: EAL domain-containing protein [Gemmatimonadetes bacterium]|nr:EAL domain-containing protein [Gemmatimonadota bacterium]